MCSPARPTSPRCCADTRRDYSRPLCCPYQCWTVVSGCIQVQNTFGWWKCGEWMCDTVNRILYLYILIDHDFHYLILNKVVIYYVYRYTAWKMQHVRKRKIVVHFLVFCLYASISLMFWNGLMSYLTWSLLFFFHRILVTMNAQKLVTSSLKSTSYSKETAQNNKPSLNHVIHF